MNFGKFIRNFSTDSENENSPKKSGILSGTSKLFGTVNSKTTNIVSGLSHTFEQIKRRTSVESLSFTDKDAAKSSDGDNTSKEVTQAEISDQKLPYQDAKSYIEQTNQCYEAPSQKESPRHTYYSTSPNAKCPPPKPPPPLAKQMSTPHDDERPANRDNFSRSQTVVDRHYVEQIQHDQYLTQEGDELAKTVLEHAKTHLEMECQNIVSAMDDMMKKEPNGSALVSVDVDHRTNHRNHRSEVEEINKQQKDFMAQYVANIYKPGISKIDEELSLEFRKCLSNHSGRVYFTRLVDTYNFNSKEVSEIIFYRLLEIFTAVLLECHEQEDYLPARDLMLVAFGCYTTIRTMNKKTSHNFYLSSFIGCHPIWKSIEYWIACFTDTIQTIRTKQSTGDKFCTNASDGDGITFKQIQVHLNYMRSFGLPTQLCYGFVRKESNVVNLTNDEMRRLRELLDSWKD